MYKFNSYSNLRVLFSLSKKELKREIIETRIYILFVAILFAGAGYCVFKSNDQTLEPLIVKILCWFSIVLAFCFYYFVFLNSLKQAIAVWKRRFT